MLIFYTVVLVASFYLLATIVENYFIESLEHIANRLRIPGEAAGTTLMAAGSSAPELFISLIALFGAGGAHADLGAGTIVGSALFNILVIIGASALVKTAKLTWQPIVRDTAVYVVSIALLLFAFSDGVIVATEAALFVVLYILYIGTVLLWPRLLSYKPYDPIADIGKETHKKAHHRLAAFTDPLDRLVCTVFDLLPSNSISVFLTAIAAIALLSWGLVQSAVAVSQILSIPKSIVALTVLAAGTSIPDLLSSVIVARRGKGDMAISNAVGSNIFDILFGLGFIWWLSLIINPHAVITVDTHNLTGSIVLLFATVIATLFIYISNRFKVGRKSGLLLIGLYAAYLIAAITGLV